MPYRPSTWYLASLQTKASPIHGQGLFSTAPIRAGEVVMVWGGDIYSRVDLEYGRVPNGSFSFIDENLLMLAPEDGMDFFVNHSCDPSLWMIDEVTVVARRDVPVGDELVGDYAVWESNPAYAIDPCRCGTSQCRRRVCGDDWLRPELQARYAGHFLPYISRRIEATSIDIVHG